MCFKQCVHVFHAACILFLRIADKAFFILKRHCSLVLFCLTQIPSIFCLTKQTHLHSFEFCSTLPVCCSPRIWISRLNSFPSHYVPQPRTIKRALWKLIMLWVILLPGQVWTHLSCVELRSHSLDLRPPPTGSLESGTAVRFAVRVTASRDRFFMQTVLLD